MFYILDNSVPIKIDPHARIEEINKSVAEINVEPQHLSVVKENSNKLNPVDKSTGNTVEIKRRESTTVKRKSNTPNLLGQLNVDKKYLQDLLKRPGTT